MRLLYDYQTFSRQRYGGVSRYFFELIRRIAAMPDQEVSLFMGLHLNEYGLENHKEEMARFFGMKHPEIPRTFRVRRLLNQMMLRQFAERYLPEVYHLTYYDNTPGLGKRRIITVHDMIYERFPQFFRKDDPIPAEKRKAAHAADGIICVSESTRTDLCSMLNTPPQKTAVIYHGNSLASPAKPVNPIGRPFILYVGKRGGYKNFDVLLKAYSHSKRLRSEFKLLCFGYEAVSSGERSRLASMNLRENVVFLSGDDDVLAQCYAHASVFVYPSLAEGFGIPQLEAMHYGCPVVASDIPPLRETAADAALYFDPTSPDDLAEKIELVLHDSAARDGLAQRGYQRERSFSWDKCANETVSFYRKCLDS